MKILLLTILIVLVFGCKGRKPDCDRPFKDSSVGFMISGEIGSSRAFISIVKIVDKKDWKGNQYFNRYGFFNAPKSEQHVPIEDSCGLKRLYFKIFELPKPSPLPDTTKPRDTVIFLMNKTKVDWTAATGIGATIDFQDTTKPIKIKMQPRWRDSTGLEFIIVNGDTFLAEIPWLSKRELNEGTISGGRVDDGFFDAASIIPPSYIINGKHYTTPSTLITLDNENDTTKVIMLVSDTSSINGFISSRCWWMEGYDISEPYFIFNEGPPAYKTIGYLDQSKIPLKKNIIVWMSKEIK